MAAAFGHVDFQTLPRQTSVELLKETDYSNNSRTSEEIKHNTDQTVANINPETLRKFVRNTMKRANARLRESGGHFQRLVYRRSVNSS